MLVLVAFTRVGVEVVVSKNRAVSIPSHPGVITVAECPNLAGVVDFECFVYLKEKAVFAMNTAFNRKCVEVYKLIREIVTNNKMVAKLVESPMMDMKVVF